MLQGPEVQRQIYGAPVAILIGAVINGEYAMVNIQHEPQILSFLQSDLVLSLSKSEFCFSSVPEGRGGGAQGTDGYIMAPKAMERGPPWRHWIQCPSELDPKVRH